METQDTQSLMITGVYGRELKTICVHDYTSWNKPHNIKNAREKPFESLYDQNIPKHFRFPQKEFESLVERINEGKVFEVDYKKLKAYPTGDFPLEEALIHPLTNAFFGGKDLAREYLGKHCSIYGTIEIKHTENIPGQVVVMPHAHFLRMDRGLNASMDLTGKYEFIWKKED